jgi:S-formylglutathione hydrolase FrmB
MMKNTMKYSEKVLVAAVKNCALRAQDSYNALGSADACATATCEHDYEVWEHFLDDACNWVAMSNEFADELSRTYGAN